MKLPQQKIYNNYQIYLLFFTIMFSFTFAQYTISGSIKDDKDNILPGANVFIKELGLGAIVDFDGNFEISDVPTGKHTLSVTLISYKDSSLEITVINRDLNNILVNLSLAPITKSKIIIEGKQQTKKSIQPICKLRFNGIYKSYNQEIASLPDDLAVDDNKAYNSIFLNNNNLPDLVLGVSKEFTNGIKSGFHMTGNEFRFFIESSIIKAEIGKINNSAIVAIGAIYETTNRLNVEFDINYYNILKNITTNKINPTNNLTAAISLSINFD